MRILKYIFLLLILIFIAVAVFVATQKGDFDITKTKIIHTPRPVVFNYVNDFNNWHGWVSWQHADTDLTYKTLTAGKGASYSWDSFTTDGSVQTISTKQNDSISQKMDMDGMLSDAFWTFKDTIGGTKVTWRIKGKMGFMPKIKAALKGGVDKVVGVVYEQSLESLDKTIKKEINTYQIKVDGIAEKSGNFYLYQSITSTIDNMARNSRIMMDKLEYFFEKNKMKKSGRPFIAYDYFDKKRGITKFSVCIPIAEEIYTAPGSDIMSGKYPAFHALKTTLTGDYSHLPETWDAALAHIAKNKLTISDSGKHIEWFKVSKAEVKNPSKWVTEIYIPIKDNMIVAPKPAVSVAPASTTVAPSETPTDEISIP